MAKDVITLITSDHREVERLFDALRSGEGDRARLASVLCALLMAHSRAEEERVYPVIAKAAPGEKDLVRHSEEEHQEAEELAQRLTRLDPGGNDFASVLDELVSAVALHVETEESEVLPALREAVGDDGLSRLGEEFSQRRTEVLQEAPGGEEALASLTREELYERAQAEGVAGRSDMDREELAASLREAHRQQ